MLDLPSCADALGRVHAAVGAPQIVALDVADGAGSVRAAVERLDGALIAILAESAAAAHTARRWFYASDVPVEVAIGQVAEGWLVVGRAIKPDPPTADAAPVRDARLQDLDAPSVAQWLRATDRLPDRAVPGVGSAKERALGQIGVLALDSGIWRPSVAALVVGGRRPDLFLPGCTVNVQVDAGSEVVRGAVVDLLRGVQTGRLDPWVVREVLLNAILHRDWSATAPISLRVVGPRLDVTNPGRLQRTPPNPVLVQLAVALGLVRGTRRGLDRVAQRLERTGQRPFSLLEREGQVRFVAELATLRPHRTARPTLTPRHLPPPPADVVPTVAFEAPDRVSTAARTLGTERPTQTSTPAPGRLAVVPAIVSEAEPIADRTATVLGLLRERGRMTTRELGTALGCSRPVVGRLIATLVADGRVRALAEGRSPFQAYEIASGG